MGGPTNSETPSTVEQTNSLSQADQKNLQILAKASSLEDMIDGKEAKRAYDEIFKSLNSIIDGNNFNEQNYQILYNAIEDANKNAFGVTGGEEINGITSAQLNQGSTINQKGTLEVEGGYSGYTQQESTISNKDFDKNGNLILGPKKTITGLNNGLSCTYQLNEHMYKSEISKNNWFFKNGEVIGKYTYKDNNGDLKSNTISIKEWGDNEYIELDGRTLLSNDYDEEIKIHKINGKPDVEGALQRVIKLYAKEQYDEITENRAINNDVKATKKPKEENFENAWEQSINSNNEDY